MTTPRQLTNLRWKKDEPERGLRAMVAGPRGSNLHDGTTTYASVAAHGRRRDSPWYWVARCDAKGVPLKNTCDQPVATEQEAKDAAMAYVKKCLAAAKRDIQSTK